MLNIKQERRQSLVKSLLRILNALILLSAIAMLIYSSIFVNKTGPTTYYSHFSCLYLSSCLVFQALQVHRLMCYPNAWVCTKRWCIIAVTAYLAILTLTGFIEGVAFSFTPKPDTTAISFLAFIDGVSAIAHNIYTKRFQVASPSKDLIAFQDQVVLTQINSSESFQGPACTTDVVRNSSEVHRLRILRQPRLRRCGCVTLKVLNRILMVIHAAFAILSASGAIELALTYRYANPGTLVQVTLASGKLHNLNYNCTSVPSSNSSLPTIWLEADAAHGIVDFLGLQTSLALDHGRNSCSYDPPNFGWSDPLPASLLNYFDYFNPLLAALHREDEEIVIAGWGGGAENALMHAIENRNITNSLVIIDASPDGIEWFDAQRRNTWTEMQMQNYRFADLSSRIFLAEIILALGIPWGLMPIFIPANSTGYFDQSLYQRYRAQGMKEDLWAYQYYSLRSELSIPINDYLINTTVPTGMGVHAIMTYNAGSPTNDNASNNFYRETKLSMANHIAGGNLSSPVVWCKDTNCSMLFPVNSPGWTANALISLGI